MLPFLLHLLAGIWMQSVSPSEGWWQVAVGQGIPGEAKMWAEAHPRGRHKPGCEERNSRARTVASPTCMGAAWRQLGGKKHWQNATSTCRPETSFLNPYVSPAACPFSYCYSLGTRRPGCSDCLLSDVFKPLLFKVWSVTQQHWCHLDSHYKYKA